LIWDYLYNIIIYKSMYSGYGYGYYNKSSYSNNDADEIDVIENPEQALDNSIKVKRKELDKLETNYARKLHETTLAITSLERSYDRKKEDLETEYKETVEEYNQKIVELNKNVANTLTHGRIILNVGGRLYETTIETIGSVPFFECLFSRWTIPPEKTIDQAYVGAITTNSLPLIDNKYHLFIDRDPEIFYYILNYLRSGVIPQKSIISEYLYEILINELVFYGLHELRDHLLQTKSVSSRLRRTMNC
jgi:hypothetical protein